MYNAQLLMIIKDNSKLSIIIKVYSDVIISKFHIKILVLFLVSFVKYILKFYFI
jgi:hypothetical protein